MVPCSRSRVMSRSTSAASCMPSEVVGSSSSSSRGLCAIARATATICRWPPDSAVIGSVVSRTGMPSFANSRAASSCSATSENMCQRRSLPSITFDATSRFSIRPRSCQTILTPSLAAAAGTGATARPPTRIEPEAGARSPATDRISVVFPAPFSPASATTSPARTVRFTSVSAVTVLKRTVSEDTVSSGAATAPFGSARIVTD